MSDQTPETALDNSEPSMEDILASIRKIIADDDGPLPSTAQAVGLNDELGSLEVDDEKPLGGIGDFGTSQDEALDLDSTTVDPGVEHFINDVASESAVEAESLTETPSDILDDLTADLASEPQQEPAANIVDIEIDDLASPDVENLEASLTDIDLTDDIELADIELEDIDLTEGVTEQANLVNQDIALDDLIADDEGLVDFDLEAELADLTDLEIPEPDPIDAVSAQAAEQDIVTRPGVAAAGLAAAGAGVLGAISGKADGLEDIAADDIDVDLSALLETNLVSDDADLTDGGEDLGDDLTALLDDTADEASIDEIDSLIADDVADDVSAAVEPEAPSLTSETALDIETIPDADDDLDALLDDIDLDEAVDSIEEVEETELETAETEEDADLLLVKTLMADLADYNTSDVSSDFELSLIHI